MCPLGGVQPAPPILGPWASDPWGAQFWGVQFWNPPFWAHLGSLAHFLLLATWLSGPPLHQPIPNLPLPNPPTGPRKPFQPMKLKNEFTFLTPPPQPPPPPQQPPPPHSYMIKLPPPTIIDTDETLPPRHPYSTLTKYLLKSRKPNSDQPPPFTTVPWVWTVFVRKLKCATSAVHTSLPFRGVTTLVGDTLAERYEHTLARIGQITLAGYQVELMWECDFDEGILTRHPELKSPHGATALLTLEMHCTRAEWKP